MISSAPGPGAAWVRKITWIVGTAMTNRTSAGAIVHAISSAVWPRVWTGGGAPGRSRKRMRTQARVTPTTSAMPTVAQVMIA